MIKQTASVLISLVKILTFLNQMEVLLVTVMKYRDLHLITQQFTMQIGTTGAAPLIVKEQ